MYARIAAAINECTNMLNVKHVWHRHITLEG